MDTTNRDILLIEDNLDDADLIIRALRKTKIAHQLVHLKDGEEALEFIFCNGKYAGRCPYETPKLIILDLKMPKVDGLEVLKILKTNEKTKTIPVAVLTSSNQNKDVQQSYTLGANSYIVKPVEYEVFVHTISTLGQYWLTLNQTTIGA